MNEICYTNNPKSLFYKYRLLVTWFANTPEGREFLQLPDEKIGLLVPNGFHAVRDDVVQATLYTHAIYSPFLSLALMKFDLMQPYIRDFDEAKQVFIWCLGLNKSETAPRLIRAISFLTLLKNPDANPETNTVDGFVQRASVDEAFSTIRGGAGTGSGDTSGSGSAAPRLTASAVSDQYAALNRAVLLFDTSSLKAAAKILSSIFSLYIDSNSAGLGQSIGITSSNPASNTALVNADYAIANFGSTKFAADISHGAITISQYTDWAFNAAGLIAINKTGITKLAARHTSDIDNSAPTWASGVDAFITPIFADNGSNKPKLSITYRPTGGLFMF